jgi:hypothetical protein
MAMEISYAFCQKHKWIKETQNSAVSLPNNDVWIRVLAKNNEANHQIPVEPIK